MEQATRSPQTVFSLRPERAWLRGEGGVSERAGGGVGGAASVPRACSPSARAPPASGGPREVARMTEGAEAVAAR